MSKQPIQWKNHLLELLVVIFGITIAFTIDKMAEERKEKREMRIAMESIMDDLRRDIQVFEGIQIPGNEERVDQLVYILDEMGKNNIKKDTLSQLIAQALGTMNNLVTSATYESLKSAGKLEDIPNLKVRRRIISFYQTNVPQVRFLTNTNSAFSKELSDHVSSISDAFYTGNFVDEALLADRVFRNMLARWRNTIYFKVTEYKRVSAESKALLEFMERELN